LEREAPGELRLVQDFVNTLDRSPAYVDAIGTAEDLRNWLLERRLLQPDDQVGDQDLERALGVREAIRRLGVANNGGPGPGPDGLATLNRQALESGLRARFAEAGGVRLEPERPGVAGALGRLLAAVAAAMFDGSWWHVKACLRHDCEWLFFDASKNHSRTWCSMRTCGNRSKAETFRRRRTAALPGGS